MHILIFSVPFLGVTTIGSVGSVTGAMGAVLLWLRPEVGPVGRQ